jgi:hypothetical protein
LFSCEKTRNIEKQTKKKITNAFFIENMVNNFKFFVKVLTICFVPMAHNVPAVCDVLPVRIRALRSKVQDWQNVGGGLRGNERSE